MLHSCSPPMAAPRVEIILHPNHNECQHAARPCTHAARLWHPPTRSSARGSHLWILQAASVPHRRAQQTVRMRVARVEQSTRGVAWWPRPSAYVHMCVHCVQCMGPCLFGLSLHAAYPVCPSGGVGLCTQFWGDACHGGTLLICTKTRVRCVEGRPWKGGRTLPSACQYSAGIVRPAAPLRC